MDTRRGTHFEFPRCQSIRRLSRLAWTALLGFAGCSSAPTLSSPAMPTTARAQKADDPVNPKPAIELTSYSPAPMPARQTAARICATVNGVAILEDELRETAYPQMFYLMTLREPERSRVRKEIYAKALEQIINREVVLQELNERLKEQPLALKKLREYATKEYEKEMLQLRTRAKFKSDDELRAMLASQGITLSGVKRQKERNIMAHEFMLNMILPKLDAVGREDLENYYRQHPEEFRIQDSITWQDIFIDVTKFPSRDEARKLAESLSGRARNGEDFARLVKEYDQGDSSWRNGEGFGRRRGEIRPPELEPILFQMRAGDISPAVELSSGFHVAKLTNRDYAGPKPFNEKTQGEIRDKLKGEIYELEYKRLIEDLKRKMTIEVSASASQ